MSATICMNECTTHHFCWYVPHSLKPLFCLICLFLIYMLKILLSNMQLMVQYIISVELFIYHLRSGKTAIYGKKDVAIDLFYDFLALSWIKKCLLQCREKQILCYVMWHVQTEAHTFTQTLSAVRTFLEGDHYPYALY